MEFVTRHNGAAGAELAVMIRFTITLLAVLSLAASAQAQSQDLRSPDARDAGQPVKHSAVPLERYLSSYGTPHSLAAPAASPAAASSDGPTWTVVIVAGVAVMLIGLTAGRASARVQIRLPRQA
jgi:hypothetical protein